jgi:uncharacterized cupin superfamily protein
MGIREWPGFLKKTEDFEEEVVRLCTYVHAKSIIAPLVSDGPLLTHRHTNRTMREASCKSVQKKTERSFRIQDVGTTRYILEGTGSCTPAGESRIDLEPGTLMECTRPTTLSWKIASPMVILTPKFEQAKLFAGFAVAIFGGFVRP